MNSPGIRLDGTSAFLAWARDDLGVTWRREGPKTLRELFQATLGEGSFSHPVRLSGRGLASNHRPTPPDPVLE